MAEARLQEPDKLAWGHTMALIDQAYNCARTSKDQPWADPYRHCPYLEKSAAKPAPPPTPEQRAALRKAFPGKTR